MLTVVSPTEVQTALFGDPEPVVRTTFTLAPPEEPAKEEWRDIVEESALQMELFVAQYPEEARTQVALGMYRDAAGELRTTYQQLRAVR